MLAGSFNVKYQDKILLPVLILCMSAVNLLIVYPTALTEQPVRFLKALTTDTVETVICWLVMREMIFRMDRLLPYPHQLRKRIAIQMLTTIPVCMTLLILQTILLGFLNGHYRQPTALYTHHIWVYGIWLLVQNGIYTGMYMYQWAEHLQIKNIVPDQPVQLEAAIADTPPIKNALLLKLGNRSAFIEIDQIKYCKVDSEITLIYTKNDECHISNKSLDELEEILPGKIFFRANRQTIVSRKMVTAINKSDNGKIIVTLKISNDLDHTLIVSRTKAPSFRLWLKEASH